MKQRLVELLVYPRYVIRSQLDLENCPHNGFYAKGDPNCLKCGSTLECQWLCSNEEFVPLDQRSVRELLDALGFALDYVSEQMTHWQHDAFRCRCVTCSWLRDAEELFANARNDSTRLPDVPM